MEIYDRRGPTRRTPPQGHGVSHRGTGFQEYAGLRKMSDEREAELAREIAEYKAAKCEVQHG